MRGSEERFRSLVENATVGIYRATPQGDILMANPALVRMLGFTDFQDLAARNLGQEGFDPNYTDGLFRERREQDGDMRGVEAAWTRQDGSVIFVRESGRAIRSEDGKILYYDGIVEDITEKKRAEEELLFKTTLLEAQTETTIDGILVLDRTGRTLLANRQFARMWNIPEELVRTKVVKKMMEYVLPQVAHSAAFLQRVEYLNVHETEKMNDEVELKDGRVLERDLLPFRILPESSTAESGIFAISASANERRPSMSAWLPRSSNPQKP